MSTTGRDLVSASLRLIGVLASGEAASATEATDGLSALNDMLDSWSTESLLIPNKVREVFPLISSRQSYTMGTGGNFNTARPMRIESALLQIPSSTPVAEIPLEILTEEQYAAIVIKTIASTLPSAIYAEGTYPLETINVYPVPSAACSLVLYSWKQLASATLSGALSVPPGYLRAMRFNLAVELSAEYGRAAPEVVAAIAMTSKAEIKRMNIKPYYLEVDNALRAKPAAFNWITGK